MSKKRREKASTSLTPEILPRVRDLDAIVAEIADKMRTGSWVVGTSHRELAMREGVDVGTVRRWSADAGRWLRALSPEDREELVARNAARLDHIAGMALGKIVVNPITGDTHASPDLKAAVSAVAEQNKLLGLNAPERHEHAHVVAQFEQLSVEAKRARLLEARAKIDAALAALGGEDVA